MNMKRILSLALMALLLCLPVWAMAENTTIYLEEVNPNQHGGYIIDVNQNVTLTQRNSQPLKRAFYLQVNGDVSVTLQDINISDYFQIFGNGSITLQIEGTNTLATEEEGMPALYPQIPTIIKGSGTLNCTSEQNAGIAAEQGLTIQSGNINATGRIGLWADSNSHIIVSGGSVVAIGSDYAVGGAWNSTTGQYDVGSINITNSGLSLKAGEDAASAVFVKAYQGEKYLKISSEQPSVVNPPAGGENIPNEPIEAPQTGDAALESLPAAGSSIPQTGDDSNFILWSALACISLFGMTVLACRRKEE